ncbi:type I-E CRISPR-associated protein Cas6/Cse3/CasE [Nocardiopsis sp. HNM0947]|uniref:Type I-E CRISPR-associated protein Cas6/Cse3/CasE n=1 Tax=Nocardiopsis coralli TaxID=2772213 RepID=A0ABR9PE54_9ACTN|nr:type I-E CRISPR-associated protein Cas6/Cse3/CasE [Nocardiopsis coralli]MBE3002106.1 type I-E CRISPR-associated protein Cas6/Cse3/CasE [Nocardiopsis coralli]
MYLTRFRINTHRSSARKLLSSPQVVHAAVMGSFPRALPDAADGPRVLWRLDRADRAQVHLYVVSPDRPDLTHLVEQAGWPHADGPGWDTHEYGGFLDRLAPGQRWAFRLTANPTHSIRRKDGEPTKVTAHVTAHHQARWLLQRQERLGFEVERSGDVPEEGSQGPPEGYELLVHGSGAAGFDKPDRRRGGRTRVSLVRATFDGQLTVTDPDALRAALRGGIGRAKAYGCGLMTLAPVR